MEGPIRFEASADQVDLADGVPVTIASLSDASNLIRVPAALALYKPAGDVYTVGDGSRVEVLDEDGTVWFAVGAKGFLDQATEQVRLHLAGMSGKAFSASNLTLTFTVVGAISKGTASPVLRFGVWFESYAPRWH